MITETERKHIETNLEQINAWIGVHANLQVSDITKPIFDAYERETEFKVEACNDCKIDALIWARLELKKLPTYKAVDGEINSISITNDGLNPNFIKTTKKSK